MYRKLNLKKGDIIQEEHLAHIEQGIADATPMVNVTYAELVALRDKGELIAGQMYRMTDYETTCTWENTQVAGHPFDLVLTALDNKTLDEKCSAIWSERDTDGYFANSNLPAWDVRYCLDNDTERFEWAAEGGKGVIYRLIDESRNDVPYDFKNIMFTRPLTEGKYDAENGVDTFCYTFCCIDLDTFEIADQSVAEPHLCTSNKFQLYCYDNVFLTFKEDYCEDNTFGHTCYSNTFGSSCYRNTFGSYCESNIFGFFCSSNIFGNGCYSNTLGDECGDNILEINCYSNILGKGCCSNTFKYSCYSNTFGDGCDSNILGNYCSNNIFGHTCYSNTFGSSCDSNTFVNSETASYGNAIQNYHISCISEQEIHVFRNRNYDTYITKDKNGNIVEYTIDDIINK